MQLSKSESKINDHEPIGRVEEMMTPPPVTESKGEFPLIESTIDNERYSTLLRQVLTASGPIMATIAAGMTSGYSAVLLPQLQKNDSAIQITQDQASWIASMAALPMSVGCIFGGVLMEKYGRRISHMILSVPFVIGWVLIAIAHSLIWILIGRFLTGFSVGLLGPVASVYIAETSGPKYRGFLLAGVSLAIAIGILASHILGTYLTWKLTAVICAFLPLLCYILVAFVPESPAWLLSQGNIEHAAIAFKWNRGGDMEAVKEFKGMVDRYTANVTKNSNYSWINLKQSTKEPGFLRPLGIILVFFFTMQFAGVNAVAFYSVSIMRDTVGAGMNEYTAMLIIDTVRFFMSIAACILLRKVGRRPLTVISGLGTAFSLMGLSAFLYVAARRSADVVALGEAPKSDTAAVVLPLALLIGYICFVSIGIVPLPWCMTGEIFPLALRGLGSGIASSFNFLIFFAVVKTGPLFFNSIGPEGAFLIYGCVAFCGTIFLYFYLPETKNKTLQEIEEGMKTVKKIDGANGP